MTAQTEALPDIRAIKSEVIETISKLRKNRSATKLHMNSIMKYPNGKQKVSSFSNSLTHELINF
ncbi:MAG: hypothetical protein QXY90_06895 [Candidatus Anstonellales archaeon]